MGVRFEPGDTQVFKPADIYKIFSLEGMEVTANGITEENPLTLLYRYSQSQGRTWSAWKPMTDENLANDQGISKLRFTVFEISAENEGTQDITLHDVELVGNFQNVSKDYQTYGRIGLRGVCIPGDDDGDSEEDGDCDDCNDAPKEYIPSENTDLPTFDPYQIGQLGSFYNYVNNQNAQLWGHEIDYFKVEPDPNGADVFLHEYQLYDGSIAPKRVKVLVPDNQFPDNQIKFNEFNLDLFETFEIHITKDTFKAVFGIEERPGQRDVLLFCKLNRLYEVEQVMHDRGAFNTSTYYRVVLKKYSKDANVDWSNSEAREAIEALTSANTLDTLFGSKVSEQSENESKPEQYKPTSAITQRSSMDSLVKITEGTVLNASLTVATGWYTIPQSLSGKAVSYGAIDQELALGDSRYVSMWFKLNQHDPLWTFTLFDNWLTDAGYRLTLYGDTATLLVNEETYTVSFAPETDVWYCALAGVNGTTHKVELFLYRRDSEVSPESLSSSALVPVAGQTWSDVRHEFETEAEAGIGSILVTSTSVSAPKKRASYLATNVRLYRKPVELASRNKVLNSLLLEDDSSAMLVDNAERKINSAYLGNP